MPESSALEVKHEVCCRLPYVFLVACACWTALLCCRAFIATPPSPTSLAGRAASLRQAFFYRTSSQTRQMLATHDTSTQNQKSARGSERPGMLLPLGTVLWTLQRQGRLVHQLTIAKRLCIGVRRSRGRGMQGNSPLRHVTGDIISTHMHRWVILDKFPSEQDMVCYLASLSCSWCGICRFTRRGLTTCDRQCLCLGCSRLRIRSIFLHCYFSCQAIERVPSSQAFVLAKSDHSI